MQLDNNIFDCHIDFYKYKNIKDKYLTWIDYYHFLINNNLINTSYYI